MSGEIYLKTITDLLTQRDGLLKEIQSAQQKVAQIEAAIANLRAVIDEPDISERYEGTLAEAIRASFGTLAALGGLTPRQVRDHLQHRGYDLDGKHNNPLASIHAVLKRMDEAGELNSLEDADKGRIYYRRITASPYDDAWYALSASVSPSVKLPSVEEALGLKPTTDADETSPPSRPVSLQKRNLQSISEDNRPPTLEDSIKLKKRRL